MAGINFVILKINGIDVTDIPHEEAVQIFLKAPEPILVEVRRRLNDSQQQQQSIKKPSTPSHETTEKSLLSSSSSSSRDQGCSGGRSGGDLKTTIPTDVNNDNVGTMKTTTTNVCPTETNLKSQRTLGGAENSLESSSSSPANFIHHRTITTQHQQQHHHQQQQQQRQMMSSSDITINSRHNDGNITNVFGNFEEDDRTIMKTMNTTGHHHNNAHQNIITSPVSSSSYQSAAFNNTTITYTTNDNKSKCYVSTAVQTDMFTSEFIFNNSSIVDDQTNEDNIFEECLAPEIDIEEITLRKSASSERLGLTVKYSSGNASGSDDTDTCTEVYISDIMPDSVAARDGRLRQGDQILQVNGRDVSNKEETETLIAENKNAVTLLVSRCLYTDDDFNESGEFYEDEEQQIAYENYSVEQQCIIDNRSVENASSQEHTTNTSSTKSSLSPRHIITTNIEKSQPLSPLHQHQHQQHHQHKDEQLASSAPTGATILSDPLHHTNIKAHLESVNHEIAMLNTRVENMMLHKKSQNEYLIGNNQNLNSVYRVPVDNITMTTTTTMTSSSSPSAAINENSPTNNRGNHTSSSIAVIDDEKSLSSTSIRYLSRNRVIDSDTEHIYETIPESSESEPFYCSPYESSDQNLVEKWLEAQQDDISLQRSDRKMVHQIKSIKQQSISNNIWQKSSTKSNSSGDDRENSSSAYNTGGSCNSNNQLTLELNSNDDPRDRDIMRSTLTLCPPQRPEIDPGEGCKQCQRQKKEKNSPKRIIPFVVPQQSFQQQQQQQMSTSYPQQNVQRSRTNEQTIGSNCSTLRANEEISRLGKTIISNSGQIPTDTMYTNRANLHQTMLLQQKLFRQALIQQNQQVRTHFTAPNLSQYYFVSGQEVSTVTTRPTENDVKMEWKVKRRQDGTRYIVRRPTRNRILRDRAMKISEERNECTTEDDTISEIKTGRYWTKEERKKHIERAKERRHRQQLIILNKNGNFPTSSSGHAQSMSGVGNIGSGCIGGAVPPSQPPSVTPNRTPASIINVQQQQQQQQQIQSQYFSQITTGKPPRQNPARVAMSQSHPVDSITLHKKVLKKKTNKDEALIVDGNKQIAGGGSGVSGGGAGAGGNSSNKMTGLLSVTTV